MDELLDFAILCAMESGRIQRQYYRKKFEVRYKGEINLVTEVDLACQARIIELISQNYPGHAIISEEKENVLTEQGPCWIIDPLDGTTNYAHGYPFFGTSIAYEEGGQVLIGAVYNPIFEELFYAKRGEGAYFNGEQVHVSSVGSLKGALLSTGFPYDLPTAKRNNVNHFLHFIYRAQAVRRDGSAALNLCYVACGRFDGHWEMRLNPWDLAAGALIVEEAEGRLSDLSGRPLNIFRGDILASNGAIHEEMLQVLSEGEEI
jgi:myo-inositol-1(or 4)-monophosphatase